MHVITYQLAYIAGEVSLCSRCERLRDHGAGALGPVSRGAHEGDCEGQRHDDRLADRIAEHHGCELVPGANGRTVLARQRHYSDGREGDSAAIRAAREHMESCGISTAGWLYQ